MTTHREKLIEAEYILRVAAMAEDISDYVPTEHFTDEGVMQGSVYEHIYPAINEFVREARSLAATFIKSSDIKRLIEMDQ